MGEVPRVRWRGWPEVSGSSASASAASPNFSSGTPTVLNRGSRSPSTGTLSKPLTSMSSGIFHRIPRRAAMAPTAMASLIAATSSSPSSRSWRACGASKPPSRANAALVRVGCIEPPAARARALAHQFRGPPHAAGSQPIPEAFGTLRGRHLVARARDDRDSPDSGTRERLGQAKCTLAVIDGHRGILQWAVAHQHDARALPFELAQLRIQSCFAPDVRGAGRTYDHRAMPLTAQPLEQLHLVLRTVPSGADSDGELPLLRSMHEARDDR